jgi:nitrogen-specific signal transduction histidine kinase
VSSLAFAPLIRALPWACAVVDGSARILCANEALARLCGEPVERLAGRALGDILGIDSPREQIARQIGEVVQGKTLFAADVGSFLRLHASPVEWEGSMLVLAVIENRLEAHQMATVVAKYESALHEAREAKHAIANIVMGMNGRAELVLLEEGLSREARSLLREMIHEGNRIGEVSKALDFGITASK